MTTRLGLAMGVALLGATAGCNQILGTDPPLPFGTGLPAPCGDAEWTHWVPGATHVYDTTHGPGGQDYVTDGLTGLAWPMPAPTDVLTWDDANAYCEGLSWGGLKDYRLPTLAELASLTRYDLVAPALDPAAFPDVGGTFWTSSPVIMSINNSMYVVSHGDGTINGGMKVASAAASAWCVHDLKPAPKEECERYSLVDGEQAVQDSETGLVWQRAQSSGMKSWADAQLACHALPIGGYTWRVPEVSELISLLDVTGNTQTGLAKTFFGDAEPSDFYWTATVDAAKPKNNAWSIDTQSGFTSPGLTSTPYYVRCVR